MSLKSLKQLRNLANKRVLVRVDYNVPIKNKEIGFRESARLANDTRLVESLPTLQYLIKQKAKLVIVTHVGRPEGQVVPELKVDPIVKRLSELLKKPVKKLETGNWKLEQKKVLNLRKAIHNLKPGQIVMLENIRFSPDENKNTGTLAKDLASLADVFVLDGFAVAHRDAASVSGVSQFLPSYAGLLLEKEIIGLDKVMCNPQSPFVVVLGGAKMETKVPVMKNLLPKADYLLIGGGIVNTYLRALGYEVGKSLVDTEYTQQAFEYGKKKKVIKPIDVIVGTLDGKRYHVVEISKKPRKLCAADEAILDIGPATIKLYADYIKQAKTLVWNGAMGFFEQKPYSVGTLSIARLVASRSKGEAYGVIGGGETLQSMEMVGMSEYVDLVSTGGGAMLEYLSGKELPGIAALMK